MNKQQLHLQYDIRRQGFSLTYVEVGRLGPGSGLALAEPLTLVHALEGSYAPPTMILQHETVQVLMDDLWLAGVRPSKRLHEQTPLDHIQEEVKWNHSVIERLLPG